VSRLRRLGCQLPPAKARFQGNVSLPEGAAPRHFSWPNPPIVNRYFPRVEYRKPRYQMRVSINGISEIGMTLRLRLQGLTIALAIFAVLGGGMLLSACGTVAGAGQDVSAIGNTVSGGAVQTQRATGIP
jgi:predicted small secreted protein